MKIEMKKKRKDTKSTFFNLDRALSKEQEGK